MRGLYLLVLLVLLLPTTQCGLSSFTNGPGVQTASPVITFGDGGSVVLSEVSPSYPSEHVILENRGETVDLDGWYLSDGEGTIKLVNLSLQRGERLGLAGEPASFLRIHPSVRCIELPSSNALRSGSFILADAGDDLRLLDAAGECRDSLIYGSRSEPVEGWTGAAVGVTKGHAAVRTGPDTDTAADWTVEPPGRSDLPVGSFRASVEPFTAPEESRERVLREIALASFSLRVAIYDISDPLIISALCQRSREGVEVKVLAEGQPVAGIDGACAAALAALADSGCEVKVLASEGGYKRYDYLHCKYLVADSRRTLVMSENWAGGLVQNRGWGAVCDGRELAEHMTRLFEADFVGTLDTRAVAGGGERSVESHQSPQLPYRRYIASVAPLISPDNAAEQYIELLRAARTRVLVQLLYVQEEWVGEEGLLSEVVAAAARGAQVRVLLDSAWSAQENLRVARHLNEVAERGGWDLQAKLISPYHDLGVMHNKGMVVDGTAVVSSLNWCDSALRDNREVGLAIASAEVSDYFAGIFWTDWSDDPYPPSLHLPWYDCTATEGVPVLIDASNATDASGIGRIEYDLGGDGSVDGEGLSWTVAPPPGVHVVVVTAFDRFNNSASRTCTIEVLAAPPPGGGTVPLILITVPVLFLLAVAIWKRIMPKLGH